MHLDETVKRNAPSRPVVSLGVLLGAQVVHYLSQEGAWVYPDSRRDASATTFRAVILSVLQSVWKMLANVAKLNH